MESLFDTKPEGPGGADAALIAAYLAGGRTLDDLPYTDEFESMFASLGGGDAGRRWEVLHRLQGLRKANKLPRLGRSTSPSVKVTVREESLLSGLVCEAAGTLGQRDQLLYDPRFDAIAEKFNAQTGRSLTRHDLWRLVAKIAK